jgi:hypothetical protein
VLNCGAAEESTVFLDCGIRSAQANDGNTKTNRKRPTKSNFAIFITFFPPVNMIGLPFRPYLYLQSIVSSQNMLVNLP